MISEIFELQKNNVNKLRNSSVEDRLEKLNKLENWILENRDKIKEAIFTDFKRHEAETDLIEIYPSLSELRFAKKNLAKWVRPKRAKKTLTFLFNKTYTRLESKGNVLIIAPWNFPFMLTITPLISAIAAGNTVIIKPSEISNQTSELLKNMVDELFTVEEVEVFLGDKSVSEELLALPFNHIFFTGSTNVGKIVAEAAIKNFATYTLELGGKSPVIVNSDVDIESAAYKIAWGKFINIGQTCVAPDYLFVHSTVKEKFIDELQKSLNKFYGDDVSCNPNFARVVNEKNFKRLTNYLDNENIISGGNKISDQNYLAPTFVESKFDNSKLLEEEIFGPILPIISFSNIDLVIEKINEKNPPLAIYIFSEDDYFTNHIIDSTQSGGVGINEVDIQFNHPNLPFGGIAQSGVGRSHGFAGFKEFSNERSFIKAGKINPLKMFYPPYTDKKKIWIDLLVRYF